MANIKDLKKRIRSVKGIVKITSAMKLVDAAKFNRSQNALLNSRPYAEALKEMLGSALSACPEYESFYNKAKSKTNKALIFIISSDRGLCGSYNSQLAREVMSWMGKNKDYEFSIVYCGKKVFDIMRLTYGDGKLIPLISEKMSKANLRPALTEMMNPYLKGDVSKIFIAYNEFKTAMTFNSKIDQILPLKFEESSKNMTMKFEPNAKTLLDQIVPEYHMNLVQECFLNAFASEHGARMTAMDTATRNCEESINDLTLKMNKLRQSKITTEIVEVVSGAESLK